MEFSIEAYMAADERWQEYCEKQPNNTSYNIERSYGFFFTSMERRKGSDALQKSISSLINILYSFPEVPEYVIENEGRKVTNVRRVK